MLLLVQLVRAAVAPLLLLLGILIPWVRARLLFELRNFSTKESHSFKKLGIKADFAFEVSSEGELEQIRPLLKKAVALKKIVEIIFASESVERKCLDLYNENSELIRVIRLPLLLYPFISIKRWLSSKTLIFCRYDFYPELILLGPKKKMVVLSATLKGHIEEIKSSKIKRWYYKNLYKMFDYIVAASKGDVERFRLLGIDSPVSYDFRVERIKERVDLAENKIKNYPFGTQLNQLFTKFSRNQRVIIGNAWPIEILSLTDKMLSEIVSGRLLLFIAPHKLGAESVNELMATIAAKIGNDIELITIDKLGNVSTIDPSKKQIFLILTPAILCEMYSFFGHALIGGGFGRSVHSVFEPFFAGCYCYMGKKTFRSTEYDLASNHSPERVRVLDEPAEFYKSLIKDEQPLNFDWDSFTMDGKAVERFILEESFEY